MMEILKRGAAALGLELDAGQLAQFDTYYRELIAWNRRCNLTAITENEGVQTKHFLDSLTIASVITPEGRVLDVGSGAGLPGLPLKILYPIDFPLHLTTERRFKKVPVRKIFLALPEGPNPIFD